MAGLRSLVRRRPVVRTWYIGASRGGVSPSGPSEAAVLATARWSDDRTMGR